MLKKIGIFGGTFNPVHNMHISMAERFCDMLELDICLFVPAYISPFKTEDESAEAISPEHRIGMLKSAINKNPKFRIETYEIERQGISYTIDTLKHLINLYSEAKFFLLTGSDQAIEFTAWKDWEEILNITQLCIVNRPQNIKDISNINNTLTIGNKQPLWLEIPVSDISSSRIREKIKSKQSISGLVPESVEEYIRTYNLYRD
ncbi:nicotinate (nicotinamide) nucleotide adenylyltransferase [Bacteroidota bacterium]